MECPNCGAEVRGRFCEYCGSEMPADTSQGLNSDAPRTVINNYYQTPPEQPAVKQPEQRPVYQPAPPPNNVQMPLMRQKSKSSVLLLCIFLGIFGVHRFYTGKIGMGILYLLTYGLFGVGWLVDIILIATGSYRDSRGLPLR